VAQNKPKKGHDRDGQLSKLQLFTLEQNGSATTFKINKIISLYDYVSVTI